MRAPRARYLLDAAPALTLTLTLTLTLIRDQVHGLS